jgi:hypothetical protein
MTESVDQYDEVGLCRDCVATLAATGTMSTGR